MVAATRAPARRAGLGSVHTVRAPRERRIDRRGLAQAGRSSAMSDDCWRLCGEATPLLAADTWRRAGCCSGGGCAGARRQDGTDCGQQRGRAGRRHAAPRCALRPSLPLVFSSRSVQLWRPAEALCCCFLQFLCSDSSVPAQNASEGLRGQAFARLKWRTDGRDWLLSQRHSSRQLRLAPIYARSCD